MKANILLSSMVIMSTIALFSSCSERIAGTEEVVSADLKSGTIADPPVAVCVISGTVTDAETAGLLFMREEEKMARDVYAYLYEKYKLPVFKNITSSENIHMSAVLRLITGFNITDNSTNNPGEYTNTHITELYNQLIEMGNISVIDALKVGVLIEETDIADLKKELSVIENASVKTVYSNLLAGSNAHLKAFIWNLKVRGVTL